MYWQDAISTSLLTLINHQRIGLITDMDGTISPIVAVPSAAQPTPRNRALLQQLHHHLALVAVISGRGAADVRARVDLPELVYIGNHGLERWHDGRVEVAPTVVPYRPQLEAAKQRVEAQQPDGVWVEDKGATLSIHYRNTTQPDVTATALRPILERITTEHGLRLFAGRMVFEVRPPIDVDKGTAFHQLIHDYQLDAALYLGDDTTDVDALRMAQHLREQGVCYALAVGVESDDMPPAVGAASDVMVSGVSDVEALLDWLLTALSASSTCA